MESSGGTAPSSRQEPSWLENWRERETLSEDSLGSLLLLKKEEEIRYLRLVKGLSFSAAVQREIEKFRGRVHPRVMTLLEAGPCKEGTCLLYEGWGTPLDLQAFEKEKSDFPLLSLLLDLAEGARCLAHWGHDLNYLTPRTVFVGTGRERRSARIMPVALHRFRTVDLLSFDLDDLFYLSPETLREAETNDNAIYAMAMLALGGMRFAGGETPSARQWIEAVVCGGRPPASSQTAPPALRDLVRRCLRRGPEQNMDLEQWARGLEKLYRQGGVVAQIRQLQQSDSLQALALLRKTASLGWSDASLFFLEGDIEKKARRLERAVKALEAAHRRAPTWREPILELARLSPHPQDLPTAFALLDQALALYPTDLRLRLERARLWKEKGDPLKALEECQLALKLLQHHPWQDPETRGALYLVAATLLLQGGALQESLQLCHTALCPPFETGEAQRPLRQLLAELYLQQGELNKAIDLLTELSREDRTDEETKNRLTQLLKKLGEHHYHRNETKQTIDLLLRAVEVDEQELEARNLLVYALSSQGRWEEALFHLQKSLSLDPQQERERKYLLMLLDKLGQKEENLRFILREALKAMGQEAWERAQTLLQKALGVEPDNAWALAQQALCCFHLDQPIEAMEAAQRAIGRTGDPQLEKQLEELLRLLHNDPRCTLQ